MASNYNAQQGFSSDCKWSLEFDCAIVNGILAPVPLSVVPLETKGHYEQQQQSDAGSSSKTETTTTGIQELSVRLFKFLNAGEQYVLETHEVKSGGIGRFHLRVIKENDGWKVMKSNGLANTGHHNVCPTPMLEDPVPLVFRKRCEFSLQERLIGWTVEHRKRTNGRDDAFYYHRGRQFRSFTEMASFILYSSKQKELELINSED